MPKFKEYNQGADDAFASGYQGLTVRNFKNDENFNF